VEVGDGFAASHFFLDLAGLRFCDCAGLNLFLRVQQRARAAGGSVTYRGRYAEQVTMERNFPGAHRSLAVA
jgi:anti-anti-sigma regulatory factor